MYNTYNTPTTNLTVSVTTAGWVVSKGRKKKNYLEFTRNPDFGRDTSTHRVFPTRRDLPKTVAGIPGSEKSWKPKW